MSAAASAQSATHRVTVIVTVDAQPVSAARIIEAQTGRLLAHTNTQGVAVLNLPLSDTIRAVSQAGTSLDANVSPATSTVRLRILKTVARVRTHNPSNLGFVSGDDIASIVFGGPSAAVSTMPGFRPASEGGNTSSSVDGLDLPDLPGRGSALPTFPSDLVTSASVSSADDGSIKSNFQLLVPSARPERSLSLGAASFSGANFGAQAAARIGKFGYAAQYYDKQNEGALSALDVPDSSGLTYGHAEGFAEHEASLEADYSDAGDYVQIVGFGDLSRRQDISRQKPGDVLVGVGPGNASIARTGTGWLYARRTVASSAISYLEVHYGGKILDDESNARLFGVPVSSNFQSAYWGASRKIDVLRMIGGRTLGFFVSNTATNVRTSVLRESLFRPNMLSEAGTSIDWTAAQNQYRLALQYQQQVGFTKNHDLSLRAQLSRNTSANSLFIAFYNGIGQKYRSAQAAAQALSPPTDSTVTCSPLSATVSAPALVSKKAPEVTSFEARWRRSLTPVLKLDVGGYGSQTRNALVDDIARNDGAFPPSYLDALGVYAQDLCETTALPEVYFERYVNAPSIFDIDGYTGLEYRSGSIIAKGFIEALREAAPDGIPGEMQSDVLPWRQIPGVPVLRGNLMLGYVKPRYLAGLDVSYEGVNNEFNLPAHFIVNAGAQLRLGPGRLQISLQNALDAYGQRFASPRYAVYFPTASGAVPTLATPLDRTWSLKYVWALRKTPDAAPTSPPEGS